MIGVLIATYDFAEIVAKPVSGLLADRQGMKRTLLAGLLTFMLASLLYLVISPRLLLLVRFLQGVGAAAFSAVSLALVGLYYDQDRGKAYGVYNAIKGAGYVVSPLLGGALISRSSFAAVFVATAGIGALAFLVALALPQPGVRSAALDDDDLSLRGLLALLRAPALLPWYAVIVVNMFFVGILFGFLPVRIHALGYGPVATGFVLSVVTISYLLVQPLAGLLADRAYAVITIRIGLLLSGSSVVLIPFVAGGFLVAASVLAGLGTGIVWTNTDALISRLAEEGRMGATMGAAGSFKELGDMFGPLLIGVLSQVFGLTTGFVVCGLFGLLSLALTCRVVMTTR